MSTNPLGMTPRDWHDLADVFAAGAASYRKAADLHHTDASFHVLDASAKALTAQSGKCLEVAHERIEVLNAMQLPSQCPGSRTA